MTGAEVLQETDVDGVRTLWTPTSGPFTAVLTFRTGRADETLATSGISHVAEHLALFRLGRDGHPVRFNGQVDQVTTSFMFQGSVEEVVDALASVCRDLHQPPLERWDVERQILLAEEDQRPTGGALPSMLRWRYGSGSYGLSAYAEFGLRRLGLGDLAAWTASRFTTGNAILAIAGTPPADLRLPLPSGEAVPPPAPSSALERTPAWYAEGSGTAALLTTVKRNSAATALRHVLDIAVTGRLRYDLGASYSPVVGYEPRDAEHAHLWVIAEAVEGKDSEVVTGVLDLLSDAARKLPLETELEQWRSSLVEQRHRPGLAENWAFSHARDLLLGVADRTYGELLDEVMRTGPEDVRATAVEAAWNALYRLPRGTTHLPGLALAPVWSGTDVRGHSFAPAGKARSASSLVIGPEGTMVIVSGAQRVSVLREDVTALLSWPWGRRMLYGKDGFVLNIDPTEWANGAAAIALIDAHVPADVIVPMPDPADAPKLSAQPASSGPPAGLWPRRKRDRS